MKYFPKGYRAEIVLVLVMLVVLLAFAAFMVFRGA